jgi:hypothetical protein
MDFWRSFGESKMFSLDEKEEIVELIAWLKTKDPKERYNYMNCSACLLAQFYRDRINNFDKVSPYRLHFKDGTYLNLQPRLENISSGGSSVDKYIPVLWTFGMALERAKEALMEINNARHGMGDKEQQKNTNI